MQSYRYTENISEIILVNWKHSWNPTGIQKNICEILQVWNHIPEILQSIWKTFLKSYGYREIIADEKWIKRGKNKTVEVYIKKISEILHMCKQSWNLVGIWETFGNPTYIQKRSWNTTKYTENIPECIRKILLMKLTKGKENKTVKVLENLLVNIL